MVMTNLATRQMPANGYGIRQAVGAELTKLRSIRSTGRTLFATVAGTLLVTILATNGFHHHGRGLPHGFDSTNQSLTGMAIGSLAIGVLGVLMITGEYSSGTIRSSLAATPRRGSSWEPRWRDRGHLPARRRDPHLFVLLHRTSDPLRPCTGGQLGQPGVLRALGTGAFLALLGMFGLGLGVIIRNTAGAIAAYVGVVSFSRSCFRP